MQGKGIFSTGSFANSVHMKAEIKAMYLNGTPQENDTPQLPFHGSSSWTQAYLLTRVIGSSPQHADGVMDIESAQ